MNYLEKWEEYHFKKILKELKQTNISFTLENILEIINQTSFLIRSEKYPNECPYYPERKPCHNVLKLNCFLCACPEYKKEKNEGGCGLDSKLGKWHYHPNLPAGKIWDCSDCPTPHYPEYIKDYLIKNLDKLKKQTDNL